MVGQEIIFSNQHRALSVHPVDKTDLPQAIKALGLASPRPVIVLIGGAGGVDARHMPIIKQVAQIIAKAAKQTQAMVVSGGTDSGCMAAIGQARVHGEHQFPLVGVAVENRVTWPNGPREKRFLFWRKERGDLEPHHTHFILVPGSQWGDEVPWLARSATLLASEYRSVTVLVNGGEIAPKDMAHSLDEGRPVLVMAGTGRWADELAGELPQSDLISIIQASDETSVFETICTMLT